LLVEFLLGGSFLGGFSLSGSGSLVGRRSFSFFDFFSSDFLNFFGQGFA
jgi:hypothetical protein